jgi:hypothetical protein
MILQKADMLGVVTKTYHIKLKWNKGKTSTGTNHFSFLSIIAPRTAGFSTQKRVFHDPWQAVKIWTEMWTFFVEEEAKCIVASRCKYSAICVNVLRNFSFITIMFKFGVLHKAVTQILQYKVIHFIKHSNSFVKTHSDRSFSMCTYSLQELSKHLWHWQPSKQVISVYIIPLFLNGEQWS